jgi:hypothetical protein
VNFFSEFNSLVRLPTVLPTSEGYARSTISLPVPYNISLINNTFERFSTACGSIVSNHHGHQSWTYYKDRVRISDKLSTSKLYFLNFEQPYWLTHIINDAARYLELFKNTRNLNAEVPLPEGTPSQIRMMNNSFSDFNYLKKIMPLYPTMLAETSLRIRPNLPIVYNPMMRHRGLILEIYGNLTQGSVIIFEENRIQRIVEHIES